MFAQFPRVGIHASNLLKARMIITTYNEHVRLLSSEPFGWFAPPKSTRAWEPTLFMESLHSYSLWGGPRRFKIRYLRQDRGRYPNGAIRRAQSKEEQVPSRLLRR